MGRRSEKDSSGGSASDGLPAHGDNAQLQQHRSAERLHGPVLVGGERLQRAPPGGAGLHAKQPGESRLQDLLRRHIRAPERHDSELLELWRVLSIFTLFLIWSDLSLLLNFGSETMQDSTKRWAGAAGLGCWKPRSCATPGRTCAQMHPNTCSGIRYTPRRRLITCSFSRFVPSLMLSFKASSMFDPASLLSYCFSHQLWLQNLYWLAAKNVVTPWMLSV